MKQIREYIRALCNDLKIKPPKAKTVSSLEGTMLARYEANSGIMYIREKYEVPYDMYFSIAHELRHKYQIDKGKFDFEAYVTSSEVDTKAYNMQEEELDANAYAYVIMVSAFDVEPLFSGLDEDVKREIIKRAEAIVNE